MSRRHVPLVIIVALAAAGCRAAGDTTSGETWSNLSSTTSRASEKIVAPLAAGWNAAKERFGESLGDDEPKAEEANDELSLANMPKSASPKLLVAAGNLAAERGDIPMARQQLEQALEQDPGYLPAHLSLARIYQSQGQVPVAIKQYHAALEHHPTDPGLNNDLGLALMEAGQLDEAIARLQQAARADNRSSRYRNNLARALVRAGREQQAIAALSDLLGPATAHYNVACMLNEAHRVDAAMAHLNQALAIDPRMTAAQELMARMQPIAARMDNGQWIMDNG